MHRSQSRFPFCAVQGQSAFKLALILNAINPSIGGVLVSGPRGSAKSTLARGLADLLENDAEFVNLPLSTTEEMLIGTLDLQTVLNEKQVKFNSGLLAKAHQGVLYIDEVNLLPDNLVDLILDVSESGMNQVERDGISHAHESRFILLGTMNPDEGEIRPQLQDRFGLFVELDGQYSIQERINIVRLRETFEADSHTFIEQFSEEHRALTLKIQQAMVLIDKVQCSSELREFIAKQCDRLNVDGLRADIVWFRAAKAHAAWCQRLHITQEDILAVKDLVTRHRANEKSPSQDNDAGASPPNSPANAESRFSRPDQPQSSSSDWGQMQPEQQMTFKNVALPFFQRQKQINKPLSDCKGLNSQASRSRELFSRPMRGRFSRGIKASSADSDKPHWLKTLLSNRGTWPPQKLCFHKEKMGQAVLNVVLLDTSGSTLTNQCFSKAKGLVLKIAEQAYLNREKLSIFSFGNQQVKHLMQQQKSPKNLLNWLNKIEAGGGTPFKQMLLSVKNYQLKTLKSIPGLLINTFLITDGRTTSTVNDFHLSGRVFLVDIESSAVKRGKGVEIARCLSADYIRLPDYIRLSDGIGLPA